MCGLLCTLGSPPSSTACTYDSALTRWGDPDMTSWAAVSRRSLQRAVSRRQVAAAVTGCGEGNWLRIIWGAAMHRASTAEAQCCCCSLVPSVWIGGVQEIAEAGFSPATRAAFPVKRQRRANATVAAGMRFELSNVCASSTKGPQRLVRRLQINYCNCRGGGAERRRSREPGTERPAAAQRTNQISDTWTATLMYVIVMYVISEITGSGVILGGNYIYRAVPPACGPPELPSHPRFEARMFRMSQAWH